MTRVTIMEEVGDLDRKEGDPTPEDIKLQTELIREDWSDAKHESRWQLQQRVEWVLPTTSAWNVEQAERVSEVKDRN